MEYALDNEGVDHLTALLLTQSSGFGRVHPLLMLDLNCCWSKNTPINKPADSNLVRRICSHALAHHCLGSRAEPCGRKTAQQVQQIVCDGWGVTSQQLACDHTDMPQPSGSEAAGH